MKEVFGTREWAESNANIIDGCIHDCKYCYAKEMAIRFKRKTPTSWKSETLRTNWNKKQKLRHGRIMFPTTHDIHPEHLNETIVFLKELLRVGNELLIVSKPHSECIIPLCSILSEFKKQILFRFTVGSTNSETLRFWEPGAASFEERLLCLKYAFDLGYETSVSCEPVLDTNTVELVEKLLPYISNSIWIGKPNMFIRRLRTNGCKDSETQEKATKLFSSLTDSYFKELYSLFKSNPKVKWKESVKKILGIEVPQISGLDI